MNTGISFTSEQTVSEALTALAVGSGDLPVLSTPMMMALMENAAMLCVAPHLPEGSTTVGSQIESTHLRPTHPGQRIQATATLTAIEGRKLTFQLTASDAQGVIGEGRHVRYIVDKEKFMKKRVE
ncbi:MAG: thioesterase family protein [Bacteroidaceae bacterium]|nr:thioesterase family protein [Prevotellaceae bacterium]MDY5632898.1 thioesterase family protein [Bacteroidaceae bacterium]